MTQSGGGGGGGLKTPLVLSNSLKFPKKCGAEVPPAPPPPRALNMPLVTMAPSWQFNDSSIKFKLFC